MTLCSLYIAFVNDNIAEIGMKLKNGENNMVGTDYQKFLTEIVEMVQYHRTAAVKSIQIISNTLYWNIGELIIKRQKQYGWGKSIVEQLSKDLELYVGKGVSWSPRNLRFMRQLVEEYSNMKQLVSEVP